MRRGQPSRIRTNAVRHSNDPLGVHQKAAFRATSIEKYGTDHPSQHPVVREKIRVGVNAFIAMNGTAHVSAAVQLKYGDQYTSTLQVPHIAAKARATMLERYGVEYPVQSAEIMAHVDREALELKRRATCQERFGGPAPMCSAEVRAKSRATCIERYGVEHTHKLDAVKRKMAATCSERYGVDSVFKLQRVIDAAQSPAAKRKAFETLKARGMNRVSQIERRFFDELEATLGTTIERQVVMNIWPIDGYIPALDVYVQFDGSYWHGHGKDVGVLLHGSARERNIATKMLTDIAQNIWFVEHRAKLIRISDMTFKSASFEMLAFAERVKTVSMAPLPIVEAYGNTK